MNQGLTSFACLCLLVSACSATVEGAGNTNGATSATSTTSGSGGASGIVGAGGNTSIGSTGAGGTSVTSGSGGQGDAGPAEGGMESAEGGMRPAEGGMEPAEEGGSIGANRDAAGQDAGPPPAIDDSIWQLQLPTGTGTSPTTVAPPDLATFSNIYFYKADDGGQVFMDPATGVTTANSTHPRTELRESNANGASADWSPAATNTMTVTGKVLKGSGVTIAQVFNGGDGITLAELQYSSGGFTVFYEESRGGGGSTNLGNGTALNAQYTFTMAFSKNILTIAINGKPVYAHTPSGRILTSKFYFKVGNYDQGSTAGTPGTTAHSIVETYSVVVVHQ